MTMIDLGPERPGQPSDTRQMGDIARAHMAPARMTGRTFWALLAVIVVGLVLFFALR